MKNTIKLTILMLVSTILIVGCSTSPTVTAISVDKMRDWKQVPGTTLALKPTVKDDNLGAVDAVVKAQHTVDAIAIQVTWPDATRSDTHKTLVWDEKSKAYKKGTDMEDRVALMFNIAGSFSGCMLSGQTFTADVWHWKAARTGPANLAHDKMHIYSVKPVHTKSKKFIGDGEKTVFIARLSDQGDSLYNSSKAPKTRSKKTIPGYIPNTAARGSIADVKAKASHDGKNWTVTMTRKMNTGHKDDAVFEAGKNCKASIGCFDRSGDDHHSTAAFLLKVE